MSQPTRFAWRTFFHRSRTPVFVVGDNRRLRYANPAWEAATGEAFAKVRGTRISRRQSTTDLGIALAPPPEVWAGRPASVRRPAPGASVGPPWWDVTFVPLAGESRPLGVVGVLTIVGHSPSLPRVKVPAEVGRLRASHAKRFTFDLLTGTSPAAERLLAQVRAASDSAAPVWLTGEPGSGKETVARVIHHTGPRRERAFVGLDCGGLQPYLVEGMLFGPGGLSAAAHAGTLYLKNPARLPHAMQQKIAHWSETRHGPRLVCGATLPAAVLVAEKTLAVVFHTRMSAIEIVIPPLRERADDLPLFVDRVVDRFAVEGLSPTISADVFDVLKAHPWPGNVRELADVLGDAVAAAGGNPATRDHLPRYVRERFLIATAPVEPSLPLPTLDEVLEAVERRMVRLALAAANGKTADAAARLGVPRPRLLRRLEALGLPKPKTTDTPE